jgi:hypothetical protein
MTTRAEVIFSTEDDLIIVTYRGKTRAKDLRLAASRTQDLIASHSCPKVLVDVRQSMSAVPAADIYHLPDLYTSLAAPGGLRIAMVTPRAAEGCRDYRFYETVCRNKGFRVEIFEDLASAKAWLSDQHPKDKGMDLRETARGTASDSVGVHDRKPE